MRAVTREDHPETRGRWMTRVEKRLEELHGEITTSGRRLLLQVADTLGRTAGLTIDAATGFAAIRSSAGGTVVAHTTTTSTANARIDPTTGAVQRVTSSQAGKVDVCDVDADADLVARVAGMRRRRWRDAAAVEDDPGTDTWVTGWIAEELHAAGLTAVVDYEPDGTPVGVAYDRIPVLLHAWVESLADQLDTAERTIEELAARVRDLEQDGRP